MFDRRWVRDVALAVMLGIPTLALARPQSNLPGQHTHAAVLVQQAADAEATASHKRFNIPD